MSEVHNLWFERKQRDIRENPNKHRHRDINELRRCCVAPDGTLDVLLVELHSAGRRCDVKEGPCNCGAWH